MSSTIRDVADRANVSVATVSRFVNGASNLRPQTAEKVRLAIEELGFRPNAVGRSLSTASTRTLGVVIPSISNPVFADAVAGITDVTRDEGYTLMLASTNYAPGEEALVVGKLLENRVDGVVLTVADPATSPALSLLRNSNVPFVLIYNQPFEDCPTVTVNNVEAGKEVAEEFIRLGHTRLGMISGNFNASDRALARRNGFVFGARSKGLADPVIAEVDHEGRALVDNLDRIYSDLETAPTALFCSNDLLAISVIGYLRQHGFEVPQDISVIGFDGISVGSHLYPTLATIVQPSQEMGSAAARYLLARLMGKEPSSKRLHPHTFRNGDSAGPAGKLTPAASPKLTQPNRRRPTT